MHPMNLALIFNSIKNPLPKKPPITPTIGVKDLRIVEVVNRSWDYGGNKNYTCQLTFKGGVKVLCDITGKQITGLIYAPTFCATLKGMPSTERGFNQVSYPNYADINHDEWIAELYKNRVQANH